jgi:hypothetical protein
MSCPIRASVAFALVALASACGSSAGGDGTDAGSAADADEGIATDAIHSDGGTTPCLPLPESFETVAFPPLLPPFGNTVWFDEDIITASDPTSFAGVTYTGTGPRLMFDRRTNAFETYVAHLFDAQFGSSITVEIQVNPEFTQGAAEIEAVKYGTAIGRLPAFLFADLQTVWIHDGNQPFGGGNNNLLIHTIQGDSYISDGVLEEVFIHEATHTSIDSRHESAPNWVAAQQADGIAISPYAAEFPDREDLAETMGPYLGIRFRPERLDAGVVQTFVEKLPNRLMYLDCLGVSMSPPQ